MAWMKGTLEDGCCLLVDELLWKCSKDHIADVHTGFENQEAKMNTGMSGKLKTSNEKCEAKGFEVKNHCFFSTVGCRFKGGRSKIQEHEAGSVRQHLNLLMNQLAKLSQAAALANLPPEMSRTLTLLEGETDKVQLRVKSLQNDRQIKEICKELQEFCKRLEATERSATIVETKFAAFEEKVTSVPKKINEFSRTVASLSRQTESNEQVFTDVENKVAILESRLDQTEQAIQGCTAKIMALETMTHCGLFIWKIPQIKRRLQEAIDGIRPYLDSSEFYFSTYSYKMCLRIYLNGHGDTKGTHISLYYILLKGQYDALTQWPFKENVKLAILNPRDRHQSILKMCTPCSQDPALQRPVERMNAPCGFSMFVTVSEFNQFISECVDNDEMFVGAEIVPAGRPQESIQ
ncbi:TNF receptor-associated factor 1-like isoform X3 [Hypanus sabinus]|nr:TNF receptor-associated factor 1-like isoform X3 [Hypanus sabinus]XP_059849806.1 TNF receptor-associated factor 1-like isoform X3 [Hypanus sabinus]